MTGGFNEVDTGMDPIVDHLRSVHSILLLEEGIKSSLDVVEDRFPSFSIVNEISVSRSIDDCEPKSHSSFLDVYHPP